MSKHIYIAKIIYLSMDFFLNKNFLNYIENNNYKIKIRKRTINPLLSYNLLNETK